jgi:transposase
MEGRAFGTLTRDWLALSDGVTEAGSTPVAMESSGASWTPVDTLREGTCPVFLVNAAPVKHVPGRKTDRADARWRAKLLRDG